jgi:hypothetical protein
MESGKPDFGVRLCLIINMMENKNNYEITISRQKIKFKPDDQIVKKIIVIRK